MSSPTPLQYGKYYHVFNRGNNRENIFVEERNYRYFLRLYAKHVLPVADTYAYSLLRNHFHFLVRIKLPDRDRGTAKPPPSHTTGHAGPHPAVRLGMTKLISA